MKSFYVASKVFVVDVVPVPVFVLVLVLTTEVTLAAIKGALYKFAAVCPSLSH